MVWVYSLASVILVSLVSLIGVVTLSVNMKSLKRILMWLVSFAAGGLFGGAFIHLLPETAEKFGFTAETSLYVLAGIVTFFAIEKFIHWRHCHYPTTEEHPHPFAYMNLVGDGVHNLIDGMIIAASYMISVQLGIATTLAVFLHEIPQEIGDFGVLIHGGFTRKKALLMNFLTALTAVAGAAAVLLANGTGNMAPFLLPFAAGGFVYIAGSDLIPELNKRVCGERALPQLVFLVLGILVMYGLALLE